MKNDDDLDLGLDFDADPDSDADPEDVLDGDIILESSTVTYTITPPGWQGEPPDRFLCRYRRIQPRASVCRRVSARAASGQGRGCVASGARPGSD